MNRKKILYEFHVSHVYNIFVRKLLVMDIFIDRIFQKLIKFPSKSFFVDNNNNVEKRNSCITFTIEWKNNRNRFLCL